MIRSIHVVSQFSGSINEVTEDIIEGLKADSSFVVTREEEESVFDHDILLCHFINLPVTKNPSFEKFRHKILIQPIDGTSIKKEYIDGMNKFDVIITPGKAGKKILEYNGVTKPIEVIPNFFKLRDTIPLEPSPKIQKMVGDSFMFYHESTCHPRKGVREMLIAYVEAFSSDTKPCNTILVLKGPEYTERTYNEASKLYDEIEILQASYKYPAKIVRIFQQLDRVQLRQLMSRCDCYIQPSKIEGFGIPLLRALVLRKPCIATDNKLSGYMDWLPEHYIYLASGNREKAVNETNRMYDEKTEWITPDIDSLSSCMLRAYRLQGGCKVYSSKSTIDHLQYEKIIEKYKRVITSDLLQDFDRFREGKIKTDAVEIKYICPRGTSGYSQAAKDYIIALSKTVPVTVEFLVFDESEYKTGERNELVNSLVGRDLNYTKVIIHSTPEHWPAIIQKEREKNKDVEIIGLTVWETDKIDPRWTDWCNQVDKLIVPCTWNKEVFQNCGVTIPIEVAPHIYRKPTDVKITLENIPANRFKFYTIGQWSNRKGTEDTIKAFLDTFTSHDSVCLIVKTFGNSYQEDQKQIIRNRVNSIMKQYPCPADVVLLLDEMSDDQIQALHSIGNCYVSLAKAEGFGLGMFEAASNGVPVISTRYGGQLDFLPILLVDYELVPVSGMEWIPWYNSGQNWAQPDLEHAGHRMKLVSRGDMHTCIVLAQGVKDNIERNFNEEVVTDKIIKFLKQKI